MIIMIMVTTTPTVGSLVNILVLRWEIVGRWFDRHGWEQTHCVTYLSLRRTPPSNATQGNIQFTVEHFVQALRCAFAGCFCVFSWAPNTWWEQFFASAIRPHGGCVCVCVKGKGGGVGHCWMEDSPSNFGLSSILMECHWLISWVKSSQIPPWFPPLYTARITTALLWNDTVW